MLLVHEGLSTKSTCLVRAVIPDVWLNCETDKGGVAVKVGKQNIGDGRKLKKTFLFQVEPSGLNSTIGCPKNISHSKIRF